MRTKSKDGEAMYGFIECTVRQFMTRSVMTVNRQTTMRELAALFEKHDFNAFPVVEEGKLVGMVSKFDFLRAFAFTTSQVIPHYNELMGRPAAEVMTEACSGRGPDIAIKASSSVNGEPEDSKLPSHDR